MEGEGVVANAPAMFASGSGSHMDVVFMHNASPLCAR